MDRQNRFARAGGGRVAPPALAPRRRPELAAAGGALLLLCAAVAGAGAAERARGLAARSFSGAARLLLAAPPSPPAPLPPPPAKSIDHFVRVVSGRFVVGPDCAELFVSGTNQWELMEAAGGALQLFGASLPDNTTGPALVRALLDRAAAAGMNVVRAWAHPVSAQYALQSGPGEYSEAALRGLDYALDAARQRNIRLLLALTDNWQPPGGADQFTAWAGHAYHEDFFTAPEPRALFKAHVAALLARVNSINGRRYSEDPTIFAFNLINEPRCYKCGGALAAWIADMAAFVKLHAPNHLLTVGEEGFYPAGSARASANPEAGGGAASWAETEGQDFFVDHADPNIDFAAMHLWHQVRRLGGGWVVWCGFN
jgi:mannan endo-1,4-beta-mannosidase